MSLKSMAKMPDLTGKRVFLRLDLNVPLVDGQIRADYKIQASLSTIKKLIAQGARVIVASHLAEPMVNGELVPQARELFTIKPVADRLSELLGESVRFIAGQDWLAISQDINKATERVIVLENLRFWPGELSNDPDFASQLAGLADIYVNDAFAVSHRRQASVAAIKDFLPSFAGDLLTKEVSNLSRALKPEQPLVVVLGGAKVSDKVNLVRNLGQKAAKVLIGGGLANNFLAAHGYNVGKSLIDQASVELAGQLATELGDKLIIPLDVIVADISGQPAWRLANKVGAEESILDIGPQTIQEFSRQIKSAKTLVWNGPLGKFEDSHYKNGTIFIAREIAWQSRGAAFGIVGGGETVAALQMTQMAGYVDWVSTAGGAMLSFLGGEPMPGLEKII